MLVIRRKKVEPENDIPTIWAAISNLEQRMEERLESFTQEIRKIVSNIGRQISPQKVNPLLGARGKAPFRRDHQKNRKIQG